MAAIESQMLALGTQAPPFSLPGTDGERVSLCDADARAHLVAFICNHCPYVKHIADELAAIGRDYVAKGVAVYAISSNDVAAYPADAVEKMAEQKAKRGYEFPYLYDESQEIARAYRAACTPDFYLFGADKRLAYRGQMDASRPGNDVPVTGRDLRAALDAVLAGGEVSPDQKPSMGCGIKWKPGSPPGSLL